VVDNTAEKTPLATAGPDSLTSRFRKMEWRVTMAHGEALRPYGVNMYQAMSLIYIAWYGKSESVNQRTIEKYLYLSNPGVSKIISHLEREGYVERNPDPKDARSYILRTTHRGDIFARTLNDAILAADQVIMQPLTPAEQQTMSLLLKKLGEAELSPLP
jgi:DNA-binding MarR family transcriptional regulator